MNPGEEVEYRTESSDEKSRLDQFLADRLPELSRVQIRRTIVEGGATVDGKRAKPSYRLKTNQSVRFQQPESRPTGPLPEEIPLDILFEDDDFAAINKPAGMVVHPAKGHWAGTLVAAMSFHFQQLSQVGGTVRPGIIHRLDRDTTGVILIAKNDSAHQKLASQWEARSVQKEYLALVSPVPDWDGMHVDAPIGPHPYQREKMAIRQSDSQAKHAETRFETVERFRSCALVRAFPKTGRTHQIRIHLTHKGYPILADKLYSGRSQITTDDLTPRDFRAEKPATRVLIARQALHAAALEVDHPATNKRIRFEAPLPSDFVDTIEFAKQFN